MPVDILQNASLTEYGNRFVNGQSQDLLQVVLSFCQVEYNGRGESYLDEGERMIIWKPDGNFQIHSNENFKPINYQPTGAETTVEVDEAADVLRFVSERSSPNETLTVDCQQVYTLIQYDAEDTAELELSGTEKDMQMAIVESPELIEDGFTIIDYEYDIGLGAVDIFGEDKNGTPVIIEIKRRKAQIKHIDQLSRYINWYTEHEDDTVRGILVAPDMSANADEIRKKRGLEYVGIDPLSL